MERFKKKVLAEMRPDSAGEPPAKWQQQKSAETRVRILEATIDCLVEKGYAGLSTNEVTLRAGVSRGAMHHHFPNRMALVAAVIEHTLYARMAHYLEDYFSAMREQPERPMHDIATEKYWDSVQTREYAAYLELAIAARTDADLDAHFQPAAQRFDKVWTQEMIKSFPQWKEHWDTLQIASDFVMAASMGLLLHKPVFGEGDRLNTIRKLIAGVVAGLHKDIS